MPFLNAMKKQIDRIRIIEAGGNPDKTNDDNTESNNVIPTRENYAEEESILSDATFYGQLNALLG